MRNWNRIFLLMLVLGSSVTLVAAQDVTFVEVENAPGESTDPNHVNWIDAYGIDENYTGSGSPVFDDLAILKGTDSATARLYEFMLENRTVAFVNVEVCRAGPPMECYYRVEMTNVKVVSVSLAGSACVDPATSCTPPQTESVTFDFNQIKWTYTPYSGGSPGTPVEYCYNKLSGPC